MSDDQERPKRASAQDDSTQDSQRKLGIEFASELHRDEILIYLESILEGIKKGKLQLKQSDKLLELSPPQSMELEVKAAKKASKEKLSIKLSWRTAASERERQ